MIALTGASGFLGQHLLRKFESEKLSALALVRPDSPRLKELKTIQREIRFVDFDNVEAIAQALSGTRILVHALGIINGTEEALERVNVRYSKNIFQAAKQAGIEKVILISSVAALRRHGFYGETKYQGEHALLGSGLAYTILRPAYIFGSGDLNNTSLMIKTLKRYPAVPLLGGGDFKLQPVYVEDVADLVVQAVREPASNTAFNVAGSSQISLKSMLEELSKGLGVKRVFIPIPLKPMQLIVRGYLRLFPKTKLPAKQILELDKHEAFDISETSRVFRFKPISFAEGCRKMFAESVCAA